MSQHEKYMARCIQLALNAKGKTSPNPMVGAVIVHQDRIIGEGYHTKAGEPHAEVVAINNVRPEDQNLIQQSTIYVSLEPCAHYGKTPPCSDLIIDKNIPNIVIGCIDPYAEVAGKGIEKLLKAGRNVIVGILEEECLDLNKRFFTFHQQKRPYILLKWAQTLDGFIDRDRKNNETRINWITQEETKLVVHQWRSEEDAILVGKNTVINDNPTLTTREIDGKIPLRIVIDPDNSFKDKIEDHLIFNTDAKTIVFNTIENTDSGHVQFIKVNADNLIPEILEQLFNMEVQSILIEGGAYTIQQFINSNYWDEARVLIGDTFFGKGLDAPHIENKPDRSENFKNDKILYFLNSNK